MSHPFPWSEIARPPSPDPVHPGPRNQPAGGGRRLDPGAPSAGRLCARAFPGGPGRVLRTDPDEPGPLRRPDPRGARPGPGLGRTGPAQVQDLSGSRRNRPAVSRPAGSLLPGACAGVPACAPARRPACPAGPAGPPGASRLGLPGRLPGAVRRTGCRQRPGAGIQARAIPIETNNLLAAIQGHLCLARIAFEEGVSPAGHLDLAEASIGLAADWPGSCWPTPGTLRSPCTPWT